MPASSSFPLLGATTSESITLRQPGQASRGSSLLRKSLKESVGQPGSLPRDHLPALRIPYPNMEHVHMHDIRAAVVEIHAAFYERCVSVEAHFRVRVVDSLDDGFSA